MESKEDADLFDDADADVDETGGDEGDFEKAGGDAGSGDDEGGDGEEAGAEDGAEEIWELPGEETGSPEQVAPGQSATVEKKIVAESEHTTSDMASIYEVAAAIGNYAAHLERGAEPYVDTEGCTDAVQIAIKAYFARKIPMVSIRSTGEGQVEMKKISELAHPQISALHAYLRG